MSYSEDFIQDIVDSVREDGKCGKRYMLEGHENLCLRPVPCPLHDNGPVKRVRRGTPNHPGTPVILFLAIAGFVAAGHVWGSAVMLGMFGPLWLYGAWERGRARDDG